MKNTHQPSARQYDLDFVRVAAIVAVIVIHGFAGAVLTKQVNTEGWLIANVMDSFARWAVPVFIMISGALLIRPQVTLSGRDFLVKRFSRILLPLIAWPIIYTLWYAYLNKMQPDWNRLPIDFLNGVGVAPHLYFLFIIAGLYLVTPLINVIRGTTTSRQFMIISTLITLATTIWYTLESFLPGHGISLNILTQFIPYIGYYLLGSALKDIPPLRSWVAGGLFILTGAVMFTATYFLSLPHGAAAGLFFYSYSSIITIAMSLFAYFWLKGMFVYIDTLSTKQPRLQQRFHKILSQLSSATFGVYLIHMIIMGFLIAHIPFDAMGIKGSFTYTILTIVLAYITALILIRIPYIRRLVM